MIEVGRDLWRSFGPKFLLEQDHLQPEGRLHNVPEQSVPVLSHPHSEKKFPDVQTKKPMLQFLPIASCRWTPWKTLAVSAFHFLFRCVYTLIGCPLSLLFSRLNISSSLSPSSQEVYSSLLINSVALGWTVATMSMPFWHWGAQNWTQHTRCGLTSAA